jgi:CheY-like chemotaxis protein
MAHFYQAILVDDDPTCNFLHQLWINHTLLAENTHLYTNPDEALIFIKEQYLNGPISRSQPDLLLLDIDLGITTGFDFLDCLSQLTDLAQLPLKIFILSSSTAPQDLTQAKKYPIAGYFEKPLTEENIRQILQVLACTESL